MFNQTRSKYVFLNIVLLYSHGNLCYIFMLSVDTQTLQLIAMALLKWQCVARMAHYNYFRKSVLIIYTRYKVKL